MTGNTLKIVKLSWEKISTNSINKNKGCMKQNCPQRHGEVKE